MAQNKQTVYHGTSVAAAANIREEQHFRESRTLGEWLGWGVYFFPYKEHARRWIKTRKLDPGDVLTATLEYDDRELLDLDDPDQLEAVNCVMGKLMKTLTSQGKAHPDVKNESEQEKKKRWCLSCNMYRKLHPEIGVIIYTFPRHNPPPGPSGFPSNARQLCVAKHNLITNVV